MDAAPGLIEMHLADPTGVLALKAGLDADMVAAVHAVISMWRARI